MPPFYVEVKVRDLHAVRKCTDYTRMRALDAFYKGQFARTLSVNQS